jgi:hypothetical protein
MEKYEKPVTILMADDDADDRLIAQEALVEVLNNLATYWFRIVELPDTSRQAMRRRT